MYTEKINCKVLNKKWLKSSSIILRDIIVYYIMSYHYYVINNPRKAQQAEMKMHISTFADV